MLDQILRQLNDIQPDVFEKVRQEVIKMLYVKSSSGCQNIQDLYPIRVIKFKTGSSLNTWLDVPLPSSMDFWNTSILSFNIVYEGNMRDGVMMGAIEYIYIHKIIRYLTQKL